LAWQQLINAFSSGGFHGADVAFFSLINEGNGFYCLQSFYDLCMEVVTDEGLLPVYEVCHPPCSTLA
jgi:mannitol-specific phosphotransferase system IIBC component